MVDRISGVVLITTLFPFPFHNVDGLAIRMHLEPPLFSHRTAGSLVVFFCAVGILSCGLNKHIDPLCYFQKAPFSVSLECKFHFSLVSSATMHTEPSATKTF